MHKKCDELGQILKQLTFKKLPTTYHEEAWNQYDKILLCRSNMAQVSILILFVIFWSLGIESKSDHLVAMKELSGRQHDANHRDEEEA